MALLESLPAEIIVQILSELGNRRDLDSLICASSRASRVYQANQAHILTSYARDRFHPSIAVDVWSVARLCELPHPLPREVTIKLLKVPIEERRQKLLTSSPPLKRAVTACNLSNVIHFFICDYAQNTLPILEHPEDPVKTYYGPGSTFDNQFNLSNDEYFRLQRAFVRFELYSLLFGRRCERNFNRNNGPESEEHIPAQEEAEAFLLRYKANEIAELHCIRDYLHRRLSGIFRDVEDIAVRYPQLGYYDIRYPCGDGLVGCPCLFQSRRYALGNIIEHITSLGLEYLIRVFQTDSDEELVELMLHCGHQCHVKFSGAQFLSKGLGRHLDEDEVEELYEGTKGDWSLDLKDRDYLPRSYAWDYLTGNGENYAKALEKGGGIRLWGYCFWDYERLEDLDILGIIDDPDFPRYNIPSRNEFPRKSVQERLMGPWPQFREKMRRLEAR